MDSSPLSTKGPEEKNSAVAICIVGTQTSFQCFNCIWLEQIETIKAVGVVGMSLECLCFQLLDFKNN